MTEASWETLSNQGVAVAGVVYFLALLAYLVEWVSLAKLRTAGESGATVPQRAAVGAEGAVLTAQDESSRTGTVQAVEPTTGRSAMAGRLALLLTGIAALAHLVGLVGRGMAADPNRVPWGNMYEFTLSGTFFVTAIFLLSVIKLKLHWMGPWVVGFVVSALMLDVIWLYEPVSPLTEALSSPWLVIHVVSAVIATAAFTIAGIASILYLVKERRPDSTGYLARIPSLAGLDRISYRMHAFAFPVWTFAVLITGPIWAHQAWSSYWSWDPKEVWAFITWVVYAAYLHARATAGWKGRHAAYLALLGLLTLWFNFIGINFFFGSTSQHSYAGGAESVVVGVLNPGPDQASGVSSF